MSNTAAPVQGTAPLSTTLDVGVTASATGGGAPPPEKVEGPESPADTMRAELAAQRKAEAAEAKDKGEAATKDAQAKAEAAKADADKPEAKEKAPEKDEPEAKARDTDEPAEKAEQRAAEKPATGQEADKSRQSEGSKRADPPARFLPEALAKWNNVPTEVKAEIHRVSQEYEAEIEKGRKAGERYESIRQYDEIAQRNGRELKDSLAKIVQVEQALARNPIMGIEMILREIGPRRPDGAPLSLYEVAQHVAKQSPQQFAQNMQSLSPQSAPQQQVDPKVAALETELNQIKSTLAQQQAAPVIQDFAASHPDYQRLQPQIAAVLKSGVIEQIYGTGLSPAQKLEQAYRMAGGQSPSRSEPEPAPAHSAAPAARPVDPDGSKSVRGAPTGGEDPEDDDTDATDISKLLRKEMRKLAS